MVRKSAFVLPMLLLIVVAGAGCPLLERLVLSDHFKHFGVDTEGTYETSWTFQAWNDGKGTLDFTVAADKAWLTVSPTSGHSTGPNDRVTVTVTVDRNFPGAAKDRSGAFHSGVITVASAHGDQHVGITVAPDYFSRAYTTAPDLANKSITFTPNGSVSYYSVCVANAVAFPTNPAGGTPLDYTAGDPLPVRPSRAVSLYGMDYSIFYVSSYGYLTFGTGGNLTSLVDETLAQHFSSPRVSALSTVDGGESGTVSVVEDTDKVAVTFENVPVTNDRAPGTSNFQIELFFNGVIRLTYLDINVPDAVVGLSDGPTAPLNGIPKDFFESNFTAYPACPVID